MSLNIIRQDSASTDIDVETNMSMRNVKKVIAMKRGVTKDTLKNAKDSPAVIHVGSMKCVSLITKKKTFLQSKVN